MGAGGESQLAQCELAGPEVVPESFREAEILKSEAEEIVRQGPAHQGIAQSCLERVSLHFGILQEGASIAE